MRIALTASLADSGERAATYRDRFSRVADDILGQHRLVVEIEPEPVLPRHIGGDHDRHDTGGRQRSRDVDSPDPGVGDGRPQGRTVEHAVGVQVARVGEAPADLGHPVDAEDGFPHPSPGPDKGRCASAQVSTSGSPRYSLGHR